MNKYRVQIVFDVQFDEDEVFDEDFEPKSAEALLSNLILQEGEVGFIRRYMPDTAATTTVVKEVIKDNILTRETAYMEGGRHIWREIGPND